MKLKSLLDTISGYRLYNEGDPEIESVHMDSREVLENSLFFCIKGYTVDGHDFAEEAIKNGAVAIVSEKALNVHVPVILVKDSKRVMAHFSTLFFGEPSKSMQVIGVTGTNGKTTITHLIEQIMTDYNINTGLIGTMYTRIGKVSKSTQNTTPESLVLQHLFKDMKEADVQTVLMEVSSHALADGRVRGTDFDIAVFSNLASDHLDFHKTQEEYKFAKSLLFSQLGNNYNGKLAVLNADDPVSKEYDLVTIAETFTYGIDNKADVKAKNISITPTGSEFDVELFGKEFHFTTKLTGKFSIYNILAAITTTYLSKIPLESIKTSVASIDGVAGRFETIKSDAPFSVIVDYAHTPDSLENVLKTANEFKKGKLFVVVGAGGNRDTTKRPIMGKIASDYADYAIFTSDNPRKEDPHTILKDIINGVEKDNYTVIEDRKTAIEKAIAMANDQDIILIAGKGHETYQILADRTIDFDDRETASNAIRERFNTSN